MKKLFLTALAVVSALGLSAQRASDSSEFSFWDTDEVEHEIWRGELKKLENLEMSSVGRGISQEN